VCFSFHTCAATADFSVYHILCKDVEKIYIGKTKRDLETRTKQQFRNLKNGEIQKSVVVAHVCKEK
jgi:GIY-YIG catalytic domain.